MSETDGWLQQYEETHQDLTYPTVYWAAVPMVVSLVLRPRTASSARA